MERLNRAGRMCVGLALAAGLLASAAAADVRLPHVIASNMVLQRNMPVPIWGSAEPGEKVTVTFAGQTKTATADKAGKWKVMLDKLAASSKPADLTVKGKNEVVLKNVLVGEVWVASGQSNMNLEIKSLEKRWAWRIGPLDFPNIRLLNINKRGSWQPCSRGPVRYFSACAFYFARELHQQLNVPVGIMSASTGGSFIEQWTPSLGGDHYKGMIRPLQPFAIRGALWYQGEANGIKNDGMKYLAKQKAMIAEWRKDWGQGDFPFYYVQIVPCTVGYYKPLSIPPLWQAQRAALSVPNTGLAVTTDLCSDGIRNIHPRNKWDVGKRLSLWALAKTYGRKGLTYSGPLYKGKEIQGGKIVIHFDHTDPGLAARGNQPLNWFEIAGADGKFVKAEAVIEGKAVVVSSKDVAEPKEVRFGWDNGAVPNLVNLSLVHLKSGRALTGLVVEKRVLKDGKWLVERRIQLPGKTEESLNMAKVENLSGGLPASPFSTEAKYNPKQ